MSTAITNQLVNLQNGDITNLVICIVIATVVFLTKSQLSLRFKMFLISSPFE